VILISPVPYTHPPASPFVGGKKRLFFLETRL